MSPRSEAPTVSLLRVLATLAAAPAAALGLHRQDLEQQLPQAPPPEWFARPPLLDQLPQTPAAQPAAWLPQMPPPPGAYGRELQRALLLQQAAVAAPAAAAQALHQVDVPAAPRAVQVDVVGTYKLRLCNAYAWPQPLEMRRVEEPKLVEYPLPYKACHDYLLPLREGDQLQFKAGDVNIGTFSVRGLPTTENSLLLLIPHRREATSAAVSFDSHVFRGTGTSQVAIIDTYRGPEQSTILIEEPTRQEELKFNSVVALNPGSYKFALNAPGMTAEAKMKPGKTAQLTTKAEENYVVLRVGAGNEQFPEELVVFPRLSAGCSHATLAWTSLALVVVRALLL